MTSIEERKNLSIYHLVQFPASYFPDQGKRAILQSLPCMDTVATSAT